MPPAASKSAAPAGNSCGRESCELADVFQLYGEAYRRMHRLSAQQRQVMRDVRRCRTAALGGQRAWCDGCGFERYVYHSCRNRHCPKCQSVDRAAWVEARRSELLPMPYFHHVFTLPHHLNPLVQCRRLLGVCPSLVGGQEPRRNLADWLRETLGIEVRCCPRCGGLLQHEPVPPQAAGQQAARPGANSRPTGPVECWDSS